MIQKLPHEGIKPTIDQDDIYNALYSPEYAEVGKMALLTQVLADPTKVADMLSEFIDSESPEDTPEIKQRREWAKKYVDDISCYRAEHVRGTEYPNSSRSDQTTISRKFKTSKLDNQTSYHSMRPIDPESMAHRLQFLEEDLGLLPDQVLSPKLGQGNHVTVIDSGAELLYDKELKRLMPVENEGHADGWIIMNNNELADFMSFEGAVADCPMVTIEFTDPKKGVKLASSGSHAGWKNLRNGIDINIARKAQKIGLDMTGAKITIGPGARSLSLPDRVLSVGERTETGLEDKPLIFYLEDSEKIDMDGEPGRIVDTVDLAGRLYARALGIEDYEEALSRGQIVLSDIDTLGAEDVHSYRRDGHWNPDSPTAKERPDAGRHLQITKPYYSSSLTSVREELFGSVARKEQGILRTVSDDDKQKILLVS